MKYNYRLIKTSSDSLVIDFSKDKLKDISQKQDTSFNVEVIKNNKLGYASSTHWDSSLMKKALDSSVFGDKVSYMYPKKQQYPEVKLFSESIVKLTPKLLLELGQYIIDAIKKESKDILVDLKIYKSQGISYLENPQGLKKESKFTSFTLLTDGEKVKKEDILSIGDYFTWRDFEFDKKAFADEIKQKFRLSKKIVTCKSGKYSVICAPEILKTLLDFLDTSLSAQSVFTKVSKWRALLNKKVVDSRFNLIDNPNIDFAPGSVNFDDEGLPAKPLELIKNGVLKNFYTDLKNAERLKIKPNGRGFGIPASPELTNLIVQPGKISIAKLIKETKNGILIYDVVGGGQDSPYTGDFTLNINLGFLIENGEIVGRIKDCLVSGNIFEMLKSNLENITQDTKWVGSDSLPFISFSDVNIVAKN